MELILASNSPRRRELLSEAGFEFTVVPSRYVEKTVSDDPYLTVKELALGKAREVFTRLDGDFLVLGADTVVYADRIIGKPRSEKDAAETLKFLSGRTHSVITGYALISRRGKKCGFQESFVTFNTLSDELIESYVKTGLPLDKAGSYGIQDGFGLVKDVKGSIGNVIGLPIELLSVEIKKLLSY